MKIYGVFLNNLVVFIFNSSNTTFLHNPPSHESVLFFGAKKRTKRNIHLPQAPPYMEGM